MPVSIRIHEALKRFGDQAVVNRISLTIEPGELFFLLGPSGCGKTTLLRCIAGFYKPESGTIHIGDTDVTQLPPEKRDTGMVFQSYALWPHLTVAENVAFGLDLRHVPRDEARQRVAEALDTVRMTDRADYRPNQLSGGQQQRVALARALVIRPKCLLLDEPLSNLDAKLRLEMRTEIRRICKKAGLTALYVTHDQKEALSIADRLAVLDKGLIQQVGTPQDVYLRPRSRFVAHFIGETNFIEATVRTVSPEGLLLDTPAGPITSVAPAHFTPSAGDRVTISLRPEVIHIGPPPDAGFPNTFRGDVHHSVYLGEMAQHSVRLGSAVELKVFDLNPKIVAHDEERQPVQVWFRPANVVVLKD